MKTNQTTFVLNHLIDHGYITDAIAQNYRVRRLAARMTEIRKAGVDVKVEMRRDELGQRYAYYTLTDRERAFQRYQRTLRAASDKLMARGEAEFVRDLAAA